MRGLLKGKARKGRGRISKMERIEEAELGLLKGKARGGRVERITTVKG